MLRFVFFISMIFFISAAPRAEAQMFSKLFGSRHTKQTQEDDARRNMKIIHDMAYGADERQKMDVYIPKDAHNAPVVFMVHGGGWRFGSKENSGVTKNKIARWVHRGFIFISVNYRMIPDADPLAQADDVTKALQTAQQNAASWGGNPSKFILMGHSAGAHLIALITSDPAKAKKAGVQPWLGSISLDSGALNVVEIMQSRHLWLYDNAFGKDPAFWKEASPIYVLSGKTYPFLAVCSTKRQHSCDQAQAYVKKATSFGGKAETLSMDLAHNEINQLLGKDEAYTESVEKFMASLDDSVKERLSATPK